MNKLKKNNVWMLVLGFSFVLIPMEVTAFMHDISFGFIFAGLMFLLAWVISMINAGVDN